MIYRKTTLNEHPDFLQACKAVGRDWEDLAHRIYEEDEYASHVTQMQKEHNLNKMIYAAKEISKGQISSFTIWQRVNEKLTGDCVALLP